MLRPLASGPGHFKRELMHLLVQVSCGASPMGMIASAYSRRDGGDTGGFASILESFHAFCALLQLIHVKPRGSHCIERGAP